MKSVLIPIHPKWCEFIANGKKTVEVRKNKPKLEVPFKCYIYCTKGGNLLRLIDVYALCQKHIKDKNKFDEHYKTVRISQSHYCTNPIVNGKVIGEFVCDQIDEFHDWQLKPYGKFRDNEQKELENFLKKSCLSYDEVLEYRKNLEYYQPIYGWHISNFKIYEESRELSGFTNLQGKKIMKAPQSWMYVINKGDKKL